MYHLLLKNYLVAHDNWYGSITCSFKFQSNKDACVSQPHSQIFKYTPQPPLSDEGDK